MKFFLLSIAIAMTIACYSLPALGNNLSEPDSLLKEQPEELDEVVVSVKKPVVEVSGERIGYNVEDDASANTSTVMEILRKVPMVTVDGQGNILVNGQSDIKIYLNGKEDPMMSQNASAIFKAMPASAIKKIEVILQPGAKYDAEGTGGILNIITIGKKSVNGHLATLSLSVTNRNVAPNVYARTKVGKLTMSLNASYSNARVSGNKSSIDITRHYYYSPISDMLQNSSTSTRNEFLNGAFNLSYEANESNLFTASLSSYGAWGNTYNNTLTRNFDNGGQLLAKYSQLQNTRWTWSSLTANAAWQHSFAQSGKMIVLSYQYVHGWNSDKIYQTYFDNINFSPDYLWRKNITDNPTNEHTLQLDYTHPFTPNLNLETGAKGIFRRNFGDGHTYIGDTKTYLQEVENDRIDMRQYQNVAAVYASFNAKFGKFSAVAGTRYEYTHMGVDFQTSNYKDFRTDLNDIVPNAAINYNYGMGKMIRLNYQMRIRRPGIGELNPYENNQFSDYITKGNPNLSSEKTHQTSLNFSSFAGKIGINASATYSLSNNQISQYSYLQNDGTLVTSYSNIGKMQSIAFNGYLKWRVTNNLNFSVNASATYYDYNYKDQNISNSGWTSRASADVNYIMPWSLELNAYCGLSTKRPSLQGHYSGWDYHGISLTRKFLPGKRLAVTVTAYNFLHHNMHFKNVIKGSDYDFNMRVATNAMQFGASVSYTFGTLKEDVRKTSRIIRNDDVNNSNTKEQSNFK